MSDTSCKQPKTMSSITIVKYRLMDEHGIPDAYGSHDTRPVITLNM